MRKDKEQKLLKAFNDLDEELREAYFLFILDEADRTNKIKTKPKLKLISSQHQYLLCPIIER